MDIYISGTKSKKDEYIKFVKFWEEKWYPEIIKKLYDFCKEVNGAIVNQDLAESIAEDYALSDCQYAPISQTLYRESLVIIKKAGVVLAESCMGSMKISECF
ncbi:MAG: hypothetical protein ACLTDX_06070 [[Clostridium] innocuum]